MRRLTMLALCLAVAIACAAVHHTHATCSIASRQDNSGASEYVLSNAEKAAIIERHDWYKIHTPVAVDDMQLYQWDPVLEQTARTWAKKCFWGHSENSCRANVGNFSTTGENLASGYGSGYNPTDKPSGMVQMTENWAGERAYFHWDTNTCDKGSVCGHYTQMVWHTSYAIGCSMMQCPANTIFPGSTVPAWYLVCHYGTAGNWLGESPAHLAVSNGCADGRLPSGASRCGENGICILSGGNWHCECEPGYYSPGGDHQQACVPGSGSAASGADLCHPNNGADPCGGHGSCLADATSTLGYKCQCSPGWSGAVCDTALDPCSPNPCGHGTCAASKTGTYTCTCSTGYTGDQCNTQVDPCNPSPCLNGGACTVNGVSFICACAKGYTGITCDVAPPAAPTDPFFARLLVLMNADRAAAGLPALTWMQSMVNNAAVGTTSCPQTGRALSGASETVTRICNYGGDTLPGSFADSIITFWKSYNTWWTGATIRQVGCFFKAGGTCTGDCSGSKIWKGLNCIYSAGQEAMTEQNFKVSEGHPMLYGHGEVDTLSFDFKQHHPSSFGSYATIAAAGMVVVAAAVGLAVFARRRRHVAAAGQEYAEMSDQLA